MLRKKAKISPRRLVQPKRTSSFKTTGTSCYFSIPLLWSLQIAWLLTSGEYRILTSGGTIGEAIGWFVALERACQAQLLVEAAAANGIPKKYIGQTEVEYTKRGSGTAAAMYMQFVPEYNALLKETNGDFLL